MPKKGVIYLFAPLIAVIPTLLSAPRKHSHPNVTVVIVVDQLAYHQMNKLKHHFTDGFRFFLDHGYHYTQADHPHATPTTSVGHAALSTGSLACRHGYTDNSWYTAAGNEVKADDDTTGNARVLSTKAVPYPYGRSACNLMVDTLADQVMLASTPAKKTAAYALSIKSRSAIACAGHQGMPFWFDDHHGHFTTSQAYFKALPAWVTAFNRHNLASWKSTKWHLRYPAEHRAYAFDQIDNYTGTTGKKLIGTTITARATDSYEKPRYSPLLVTPEANEKLFDFTLACLDYNLAQNLDTLLLWVLLSPYDALGHVYGCDTREPIGMLYHLDRQLGIFMKKVEKKMRGAQITWVLTADHGIQPVSEITHTRGLPIARRINAHKLKGAMNRIIKKRFGIDTLLHTYNAPGFFFHTDKFIKRPRTVRKAIIKTLKTFLKAQQGIREVWHREELERMQPSLDHSDLAARFKNQLYPGRNGDLICLTHPYVYLTTYETGTSHQTPYTYDTQVPLMIYHKGRFEKKQFAQQVWITQLAPTLALLMDIPRPSAAVHGVLPGF